MPVKGELKVPAIPKEVRVSIDALKDWLAKQGYVLCKGGNRRTYIAPDKSHVIKVDTVYGGEANKSEWLVYKQAAKRARSRKSLKYAECKPIPCTRYKALVMEYLPVLYGFHGRDKHDKYGECSPEQASERAAALLDRPWIYELDCTQAGKTKRGHVVAYDYAFNPLNEEGVGGGW